MDSLIVVITTFDKREEALKVAEALLEKRLVACAQISGEIESVYWWENEIVKSGEFVLTLKTREGVYAQVENEIQRLHSYDTPEIIGVRTSHVESGYLKWINDEVRSS